MLHGVTLTQLTICQECGKLEIHTAPCPIVKLFTRINLKGDNKYLLVMNSC